MGYKTRFAVKMSLLFNQIWIIPMMKYSESHICFQLRSLFHLHVFAWTFLHLLKEGYCKLSNCLAQWALKPHIQQTAHSVYWAQFPGRIDRYWGNCTIVVPTYCPMWLHCVPYTNMCKTPKMWNLICIPFG